MCAVRFLASGGRGLYTRSNRPGRLVLSPLAIFPIGPAALQSFQQFRERCSESGGDLAEGAQPRLAGSAFQVGDVDLVDARMLGKVDLSPALCPAQLSDTLTRRRTDVLCHAFMIELASALYLAHTLSCLPRKW